jgi:hypothetical protein
MATTDNRMEKAPRVFFFVFHSFPLLKNNKDVGDTKFTSPEDNWVLAYTLKRIYRKKIGIKTFVVDGKRLIFVENVVAANVAILCRTIGVVGFHLEDFIDGTTFVHIDHIRRLVEFRCVLVDVIDADMNRGAIDGE